MSTPETPAGLLRRAARTIRERLAELPPSPWRAEGRDVTATQDYQDDGTWDWGRGYVIASCPRQDEAEHIAAWGPPAALAAAEWLEDEAAYFDSLSDDERAFVGDAGLRFARACLNKTPETPDRDPDRGDR